MNTDKPETPLDIDVLIQGAGIGGLSLAVGLSKHGYKVRLVERAARLSEVGAGIWMAPNALQVFKKFGLDEKLHQRGWPIHQVTIMDHKGEILSSLAMEPLKEEFGFYIQAFHRADLQSLLSESIGDTQITFGSEVISWSEDESGLNVVLSGGETIRTKLLIGADGFNSMIRSKLFSSWSKRDSGSSSYRAITPTPDHLKLDLHTCREIWAPGCRFGFSPISKQRTYWYLTFDSLPDQEETAQQNKQRAISFAREYFHEFSALVESTVAGNIIRTDISDLNPLRTWGLGRISLMGDAAHATTPNLGQGGAQAVEDAYSLVNEINRHGLTPKALSAFFLARKEKANWIVRNSWNYGRLSHQKNPIVRFLRNKVLQLTPPSTTFKQFQKIYRL